MTFTFKDHLSEKMLERLRTTDVWEWMRTPPLCVKDEIPLDQLVSDFMLVNLTPELPVAAPDGSLMGIVHLEDIMALSRDRWKLMRAAQVMRPVNRARTLTPEDKVETGLKMLRKAQELRAIPVVLGGILVGDLPRSEIMRRLQAEDEEPIRLPPVRLRFETAVHRMDGTRVGRLTRLAVDSTSFRCTHIAVRMDGLSGREVTVPCERVGNWTADWIRTTLWESDFADLPDFARYNLEPMYPASPPVEVGILPMDVGMLPSEVVTLEAMHIVEHTSLPETAVSLDHRTRIWAGPKSLGRLTEFELDREGPHLLSLGYVSGLLFRKHHSLPIGEIESLTEMRVNATPNFTPTEL